MKPKVCHFSSVHSITDTRVFYRECRSAAKHFEVTLIAIGDFTGFKDGVNIIGVSRPASMFKRFTFTVFKVFYEAVKQDAACYHIHDAEMVPFGILLRLTGKPVIYDIHENTYGDILLKPYLSQAQKRIFSSAYNLLLRIAAYFLSLIVVVAHKRFLSSFFVKEEDCTLIQNFADVDQLRKYRVPDRELLPENTIFYVGMIRDIYYDIDKVFDAIRILNRENIYVTLHLIGYFGTGEKSRPELYPHWSQISDQVVFHGFLNQEDAYRISMKCKVGLCLKNQPENRLVSHERKLFEYMAVGLPSVFCNSHIYRELNSRFEVGIEADLSKPEQIADAIRILLTDRHRSQSLSQNCIRATENEINWMSEAEKLIQLYNNLIY